MTTFILFDGDTSHAGVTRRIREELARHAIKSDAQAAKKYGRPQQWLQRHMSGETDWRVQELQDFCATLGLDHTYVLTGIRTVPTGGGFVNPLVGVENQPRSNTPGGRNNGIRIISAKHGDLHDVA
jgi:hypothetical protein